MVQSSGAVSPNVSLVLLGEDAMQALLDGDLARASEHARIALPPAFLDYDWLWRYRVDQMRRDPEAGPWLVRAVVSVPDGIVVGHAGFHGPPDERGMVEVGYTTLPGYRRKGYARAAVRELFRYAEADPRVRVIRASISPENAASIAVIRAFGFEQVGEQWDEEDGLELIYERPLHEEEASASS